MAFLTQLDAQLLLFIHDALHHEPLHNFWAGISFLGDLGWFWIFTAAVLIINPKTAQLLGGHKLFGRFGLVLGFYRRRFDYKPQNAQRWHRGSGGTAVKHVCQQCYFKKRRYAPAPV